jgi:hypothetical protein
LNSRPEGIHTKNAKGEEKENLNGKIGQHVMDEYNRNIAHRMMTFVGSDATAPGAAAQATDRANTWFASHDAANVEVQHMVTQTLYIAPPQDARDPQQAQGFHHVITINYVEYPPAGKAQVTRDEHTARRERIAAPWLERVHHRLRTRRKDRAPQHVGPPAKGFVVHMWRLRKRMSAAERRAVVDEATVWLTQKVARIASPYEMNQCQVVLVLSTRDSGQRTILWQTKLSPFTIQERHEGLRAAHAQLVNLPLDAHPRAAHLEVCLMDVGEMMQQWFGATNR